MVTCAGRGSHLLQCFVSVWRLDGVLYCLWCPSLHVAAQQQHQHHQGASPTLTLLSVFFTEKQWYEWGSCWSSSLSVPPPQVSKLPKVLSSAHQLCFSSDSSKLFASSSRSSVIVVALNQTECKYLHTLKPKSGGCWVLSAHFFGLWS